MRVVKKIAVAALILGIAVLDIAIYWNHHLFSKGMKSLEIENKIQLLERSTKLFPLDDRAYYELGKAYLDLGIQNLQSPVSSESFLRKAVFNLRRSVAVNPTVPYSHYYLGHALLHLNIISHDPGVEFISEFQKAAKLAGGDSQIYFEVGRLFLSRWASLSEADRRFTIDALARVMEKKDSARIAILLSIWELNVKDYQLMDQVLPADPQVYRQYAQFLGDRSLSMSERQKHLTRAEFLEFSRAKEECLIGVNLFLRFRIQEALGHLEKARGDLTGISFYQALIERNDIQDADYTEVMKSTLLNIARCRIEQKAPLNEFIDELRQYLLLEDRPAKINELARYLNEKGIVQRQFDMTFEDLSLLALELSIAFRQTRYRDIINFGRQLQDSLVVVPEKKRADYVCILQLVGDSFQKADYLYDAGDIYRKALEVDPNNLETLVRIRENSERLNEDRKIVETNKAIEKLLSPQELLLKEQVLGREKPLMLELVLAGQRTVLEANFADVDRKSMPLVTILFNDRVIWEDFLQGGSIPLDVETQIGLNSLQISVANYPLTLVSLTWRSKKENALSPGSRRSN